MNIRYNQDGLVPVIVQDIGTGQVVMLAYMNEEAVQLTLEKGLAHYFSRSRNTLWQKGETSGNIQEVRGFYYDCDKDAILLLVNQKGAACHTGHYSCFFQEKVAVSPLWNIPAELYKIILARKIDPKQDSYTSYLFKQGRDKILKKIGEEATEVVIGATNCREQLIYESCDLLYHLVVLWANEGITLAEIYAELGRRMPDREGWKE